MELRLLGPVEVWDGDQRIDVGHAKQRCVLAALALEPGTVVPTARLIDRIWGHDPPSSSVNVLYAYITRLRKALAPSGARLVSRSGGYLLDIDPERVDVYRFRRMIDDAHTFEESEKVAAKIDEALRLWRGVALVGINSPWSAVTATSLEDERLSAIVTRNEAYLDIGRHADVIASARDLLAVHLDDERLVGQLMLALYRSGRAAEAGEHYRLARNRRAEHFGSALGPGLRQLHQRILLDDPTLMPTAQPDGPAFPKPAGLPHDVHDFVGRRAELSRLDSLLPATTTRRTIVIAALDGTAGVGKTALALHWAHRVKSRFPDGNLYANLNGYGPGQPVDPATILNQFLTALDIAPHKIPHDPHAKATLFRSLLDERTMLVVLDNAATAEQVRPLLPGSPDCVVLVTSRTRLAGLIAADGAHPITVGLLKAEEAYALLRGRLGQDRLAAEPRAVEDIVQRCARLPIAMTIVAARAVIDSDPQLGDIAEELRAAGEPLEALSLEDPTTDVRAVFSWSYHALDPEPARTFRLLGLHPGPDISTAAAASLAGRPVARTRTSLAQLADAHLIGQHAPDRYALHDLLRAYARETAQLTDPEDERRTAMHRVLDHYLHTADAASQLLDPNRDPIIVPAPQPGVTPERLVGREEAMNWFRGEHAVLLKLIQRAASTGFSTHAWQLSWTTAHFLHRQGHWHDSIAIHHIALSAVRELGNPHGQAITHRSLARVYARLGNFREARTHFVRTADPFGDASDHTNRIQTYLALGWILDLQGRQREMFGYVQKAFDEYQAGRDGQTIRLDEDHLLHTDVRELQPDLAYYQKALYLLRRAKERYGEAHVWNSLGSAHSRHGDQIRASACYQRARELFRKFGDRYFEAVALTRAGDAHVAGGDNENARIAWQQALEILDDLDHADAGHVRTKLNRLGRNA